MVRVTKARDFLTPDLAAKMRTARNPERALRSMGLAAVSLTQRAFTQASLRPSTWPPLKPATIKAKLRKGYGSKPLRSSGALAQSPRIIRSGSHLVAVGSDRRAGPHSLAAIHQLGTQDGRVPARPTWPFHQDGRPTRRGETNMLSAARRALSLERH